MVAETREPLLLALQLARRPVSVQRQMGGELRWFYGQMVLWTKMVWPCTRPSRAPSPRLQDRSWTVRASLRIPYKHLPTGQPHPSQNGEQVAYCKLSGLDC